MFEGEAAVSLSYAVKERQCPAHLGLPGNFPAWGRKVLCPGKPLGPGPARRGDQQRSGCEGQILWRFQHGPQLAMTLVPPGPFKSLPGESAASPCLGTGHKWGAACTPSPGALSPTALCLVEEPAAAALPSLPTSRAFQGTENQGHWEETESQEPAGPGHNLSSF